MAPSEVSLATGLGQWAAGRRVALAAALAERFPRLLAQGPRPVSWPPQRRKVVSACDGLDAAACAAVEAVLAERVAGLDPARVTTVARRVATRIAADQVGAAPRKNKRDRCVQVSPGPDGTTDWWARLPAGAPPPRGPRSRPRRRVRREGPLPDPRPGPRRRVPRPAADQRHRTAKVTLGIPVITGPEGRQRRAPTPPIADGRDRRPTPTRTPLPRPRSRPPPAGTSGRPAVATGGLGLGGTFSLSAALFRVRDPRDRLDRRRHRRDPAHHRPPRRRPGPPRRPYRHPAGDHEHGLPTAEGVTHFVTTRDGTCRMWGCDRPATTCDLDHARPWPAGPTTPTNLAGLCRRHHRLKQRRRWTYQLARDGTATWTSPSGRQRITLPDHAVWPPSRNRRRRQSPDRRSRASSPLCRPSSRGRDGATDQGRASTRYRSSVISRPHSRGSRRWRTSTWAHDSPTISAQRAAR